MQSGHARHSPIPTYPGDSESPGGFLRRLEGMAESAFTPCGDGEMVWRVWGEGPPVLLLHGGSGSWRHWIANIGRLARTYRVIVPDIPGLGDSAMPPRPYDWRDLAGSTDMLAGVIGAGLEVLLPPPTRYHLVGFSLGSIAGAYLAAREQRRVRSITLIGASALGLPWGGLSGELEVMTEEMSPDEQGEVQRHNLGLIMLAHRDNADELAVHVQVENVRRARMRTHALAESDVLRRVIPDITAKVNGIWGAGDVYALPDIRARERLLKSYHPDASFHIVEGAGHWVMYEQAEAFNDILVDLLTHD